VSTLSTLRDAFAFCGTVYSKTVPGKQQIDNPVIVYQMGKVGSKSVYDSLQALKPTVPIFHCHLLNHLDAIERSIIKSRVDPKETLVEIKRGKELRKLIIGGSHKKWNLITLVRDPVSRNISAFFQNITELIPDVYERYHHKLIGIDDIIKVFLYEYDHKAPLYWFDSQLKEVFGIDVFANDFPVTQGYQIYEDREARLLVIRLEDLNGCVGKAMEEFLRIGNFKVSNKNGASEKPYAKIYGEFLRHIVVPITYIDAMYNSKFAKHFYSGEEIQKFKEYWTNKCVRGPRR